MRGPTPSDATENSPGTRGSFETTHWSVVLAAGGEQNSATARAALEKLCRTYWCPLYVYVRRQGYSAADAQDLVQGFFARLLARKDLTAVRQERGRFRSYLLGALKHFLINDWKRSVADKRGAGQIPISLDDLMQTHGDVRAEDHRRTPDQSFDHQWALALLGRVLDRLREEHAMEGKTRQFECLQRFLSADHDSRSQSAIGAELGISEGAVKQAVFRLRQRYQKLLRAEVAQTVATLGDVEDELRALIAALRS